jgi:hypothetical protein
VRLVAHGNYEKFDLAQVTEVLGDPIYWLSGMINLCANIYNYSESGLSQTIWGMETNPTRHYDVLANHHQ